MNSLATFLGTFPLVGMKDLGSRYCHGFISPRTILDTFVTSEFREDCDYDCDSDCSGWENWQSSMESEWENGDYEFEYLSEDIERFGFGKPVLLNTETRTYWNGHHRFFVASELDLPFIPFVSGSDYFGVECDHYFTAHGTSSYHKIN